MESKVYDWTGYDKEMLGIFSGTANTELTQAICRRLDVRMGEVKIRQFSDEEIDVEYKDNLREIEAFLAQPTFAPAKNLIELLIMIDAARRASAGKITAVIPYFGYARQDRKDRPRVAITARLVANLIETAGADRVLTVDLHSSQEQGFFNIPVNNLTAGPLIVEWFRKFFEERKVNIPEEVIAVAPDLGAGDAVSKLARKLGCPFAMIAKKRLEDKKLRIVGMLGESVKDKYTVILDDIISTGTTGHDDAIYLKEKQEAKAVFLGATHPILAGDALEIIKNSPIEQVVVTNTIPYRHSTPRPVNFHYLDVSGLLAEAIFQIFTRGSVSKYCY